MSTATDLTDSIGDFVLSTVRQTHELAVDSVKSWSETVKNYTPDLPYADQLPDASEVVDKAFGLAERLIEVQRDFVKDLLGSRSSGNGAGTKAKATAAKATASA